MFDWNISIVTQLILILLNALLMDIKEILMPYYFLIHYTRMSYADKNVIKQQVLLSNRVKSNCYCFFFAWNKGYCSIL